MPSTTNQPEHTGYMSTYTVVRAYIGEYAEDFMDSIRKEIVVLDNSRNLARDTLNLEMIANEEDVCRFEDQEKKGKFLITQTTCVVNSSLGKTAGVIFCTTYDIGDVQV